MPSYISVNGHISTPAAARISPLDRGFLFGDNVFEVIVCFHGQTLDLNDHLERLRKSAAMIDLEIPFPNEQLKFEIESLCEMLNTKKGYIRLVVTRGEGLGLKTKAPFTPNRVIYAMETKPENPDIFAHGMKAAVRQQSFTERGASAKTGNYLKSITELKKVSEQGFEDLIWVNAEGEVTEATTSNIFFIGREGDLVEIATPHAQSGILLGITRKRIISLLTKAQIKVTERPILREEIAGFDEAFLCSTVRGLVPLSQIGRHKLHTARDKAVFRHIERLFGTWVESELGFRVDWNTGEKV